MKEEKKEIVKLEGVDVNFNESKVLEDINLSIKEDTFLAVIGPNGGGKSTLLKVILGLITPDKGKVTVFGKKPSEARGEIGYLPQYKPIDLNFPISVYEAVLEGRYRGLFRKYTEEDRKAVEEALKTVEMLEYRSRQIGRLSGGQMQRVFLARAIVRQPRLLLLDEPTASIDPERQKMFYQMLQKLREKMAIVFVTHDIGAVSEHFKEIACLNRRLFYHGSDEDGIKKLSETYSCPIDLIGHGMPHRILRNHDENRCIDHV